MLLVDKEPVKEISVTEIQAFKRCRRAWYYSHINRLRSVGTNPNFYLGSAIHYALEKYYKENKQNRDTLFKAYNKYIKDNTVKYLPSTELVELGSVMLNCYWYYDLTQPAWQVLSVEEELSIPIVNTDYTTSFLAKELGQDFITVSEGTTLKFIIDLLIKDEKGDVWIVDHKTAAYQRNNEGLDLDYQMTAYVYALLRAKGIRAKGVIYNTILKQMRYAPEVLKDGSLSKNKTQKVTAEVYEKYVVSKGLNIDDYKEIIDYLRSKSPTVVRQYSTRTDRELEIFEKFLYLEHQDMQYVSNDFDKAYTNPSTYLCSNCEFLQLCKETNVSGDVRFILSTFYTKKEEKENDTTDID